MNKFIVQLALAVPAETKEQAEAKLREFFACVFVEGKPVYYDIQHIQEILEPKLDKLEAEILQTAKPLGA